MDGTNTSGAMPVTWSTEDIIAKRDRYYSASQRKFVPYDKPLILKRVYAYAHGDRPSS